MSGEYAQICEPFLAGCQPCSSASSSLDLPPIRNMQMSASSAGTRQLSVQVKHTSVYTCVQWQCRPGGYMTCIEYSNNGCDRHG